MKKDFLLDINSWLVAILMTIMFFVLYYVVIYPLLLSMYAKSLAINETTSNLYQGTSGYQCELPIEVKLTVSKHLADFTANEIVLRVRNSSPASEQKGQIILSGNIVTGTDTISLTLVGKDGQEFVEYDLLPGAAQNYKLTAQIPPGKYNPLASYLVALQLKWVNLEPVSDVDNSSSEGCLYDSPDDSSGKITPLPRKVFNIYWSGNSNCPHYEYDQTCVTIEPYDAFIYDTVKRLLLPPWSNGTLSLLGFAIVWLVSHSIPSHNKGNQDDKKLDIVRCLLLLFFSVVYIIGVYYLISIATENKLIPSNENVHDLLKGVKDEVLSKQQIIFSVLG